MKRFLSLALLTFPIAGTSVSAQFLDAQPVSGETAASPQEIAAQASALATLIRSDIGDRVNTASAADLEGFIVFVVDQGAYSDDVVEGALDILARNATGNFAEAIENARNALRKKRKGTGAIVNNGGGLGGAAGASSGGDFPAPGVGNGGGGSNYSN